MGTVGDFEGGGEPWWADAVDAGDVLVDADLIVLPPDPVSFPVLSVAEILAVVELAGPGAEAIRLLTSLRSRVLTEDQRLSVLQLWQPQLAWVSGAEQTALLDLVGETRPAPPPAGASPEPRRAALAEEFRPLELAAALTTSVDQARHRVTHARLLAGALKPLGDALKAGVLDPYRVWLCTETLTPLPEQAARDVLAAVLPGAAALTPARLRRALRKAARAVDPDWGLRAFARARTTRRVDFDLTGTDALIGLFACLPPVEGLAVKHHLEAAARTKPTDPDDGRCADERMADALIAAVLGSTPGDPSTPLTPKVTLQVLVPLPTLLGLRQDTAELIGYGDLPAGMARELAGDADWQRWTHDPVDGQLLDLGTRRYRPSERLRRFLIARHRYCRFPGSNRQAGNCDLDHNQAFDLTGNGDGGATSAANMTCLSRPAHRGKTHGDHPPPHPPDGTATWTTALGRTYTTPPHDYRPDSDKDPPHA